MSKAKFTEPMLIKAGDTILGLGLNKVPPKVDCRVIAEKHYQRMKQINTELLEALNELRIAVGNIGGKRDRFLDEPYKQALEAIKKAKS